jgi:hypothetical protein
MKRTEAEPAIRALVHRWAEASGGAAATAGQPSFSAFKHWAEEQGHSEVFIFRSTMGALEDAERWFDQELHQTWRN